VAASFQKAVSNIIYKKTKYAINEYEKIATGKTLVVAGGVAANKAIRSTLLSVAQESGYNFVAPPINLCTDNAAMIAFAGLERFYAGIIDDVSFKPRARWSLEDL
jgi:N6-L-threonylcarbamoyladenine synthase